MRATITAGSWRCQPAPLPSAHLAAGAGIVAAGKLRVEQAATGLVKKIITPAGEVATEILGVSAATLARAASLTAGFLLLSNNSKDDPGYQGEWAFNKLNSPFTDKDRTRLAYLEQEQEHRALSTDEQAELFVLLTRVKGVHAGKSQKNLRFTLPLKIKSTGAY